MALNVPVLPLAIGAVPGEMIKQLQAIRIKENMEDLADFITPSLLRKVVISNPTNRISSMEVAEWPEERTKLMAQYANRIIESGFYDLVRQRAPLSTFSIPDKTITDPIWKKRDGHLKKQVTITEIY